VLFQRKHRGKGALGESTMADLTPAGAAHKRHFSNGERRKVVVQHEALLGFAFEGFQPLLVVGGAQCSGDQRLSLAAGEDGGAVRARQDSDFNPDVADLITCTPVGTARLGFAAPWAYSEHFLAED